MATYRDDTMQSALEKMLKDIAGMKTLADADMPFLISMENMVLQRMKQPVDQQRQQGVLPPNNTQSALGPMSGMSMGGASMGSPAGSMQPGGAMSAPALPSSDEMQRLLASGAGGMPTS